MVWTVDAESVVLGFFAVVGNAGLRWSASGSPAWEPLRKQAHSDMATRTLKVYYDKKESTAPLSLTPKDLLRHGRASRLLSSCSEAPDGAHASSTLLLAARCLTLNLGCETRDQI